MNQEIEALWQEYNAIGKSMEKVSYLMATPFELRKRAVYEKIYELQTKDPNYPMPFKRRPRHVTGMRYRAIASKETGGRKAAGRTRNRSAKLHDQLYQVEVNKKKAKS